MTAFKLMFYYYNCCAEKSKYAVDNKDDAYDDAEDISDCKRCNAENNADYNRYDCGNKVKHALFLFYIVDNIEYAFDGKKYAEYQQNYLPYRPTEHDNDGTDDNSRNT